MIQKVILFLCLCGGVMSYSNTSNVSPSYTHKTISTWDILNVKFMKKFLTPTPSHDTYYTNFVRWFSKTIQRTKILEVYAFSSTPEPSMTRTPSHMNYF